MIGKCVAVAHSGSCSETRNRDCTLGDCICPAGDTGCGVPGCFSISSSTSACCCCCFCCSRCWCGRGEKKTQHGKPRWKTFSMLAAVFTRKEWLSKSSGLVIPHGGAQGVLQAVVSGRGKKRGVVNAIVAEAQSSTRTVHAPKRIGLAMPYHVCEMAAHLLLVWKSQSK